MERKGQAAMEYLMTYGWALLVIVIVISVLLLLNIGPSPQCNLDNSAIRCDQTLPVLTSGNQLFVVINNGMSSGITVTNITCAKDTTASPAYQSVSVPIAAGAKEAINFTCSDASGVQPGGVFSGKLYVQYRADSDPANFPSHTTSGGIVAKYS